MTFLSIPSQPHRCKYPECTGSFSRGDNLKAHYIGESPSFRSAASWPRLENSPLTHLTSTPRCLGLACHKTTCDDIEAALLGKSSTLSQHPAFLALRSQ